MIEFNNLRNGKMGGARRLVLRARQRQSTEGRGFAARDNPSLDLGAQDESDNESESSRILQTPTSVRFSSEKRPILTTRRQGERLSARRWWGQPAAWQKGERYSYNLGGVKIGLASWVFRHVSDCCAARGGAGKIVEEVENKGGRWVGKARVVPLERLEGRGLLNDGTH